MHWLIYGFYFKIFLFIFAEISQWLNYYGFVIWFGKLVMLIFFFSKYYSPSLYIFLSIFLFQGNSFHLVQLDPQCFGEKPGSTVVNDPPDNARDTRYAGSILGSGRFCGRKMVIHSNILAWKFPWTEEHSGPQPVGPRSWTLLSMHTHTSVLCYWICSSREIFLH